MAQAQNARTKLMRAGLLVAHKGSQRVHSPILTDEQVRHNTKLAIATILTYEGTTEYAPGYIGFSDGSVLHVWAGHGFHHILPVGGEYAPMVAATACSC